MARIIGCDPGVSGAVACLDTEMGCVKFVDTPTGKIKGKTVISEAILARQFAALMPADHAIIEEVHSMPRDGSASAFKFGTAYGIIRGIVAVQGIPVTFVTPSKWKKRLGLQGQDKDASRLMAINLFPRYVKFFERIKDHGRAEALLLAHAYVEGLLL